MDLITNTFVLVAPDCSVDVGTTPTPRGTKPTIPISQFKLLSARPYALTLEELMLAVFIEREGLSKAEAKTRSSEIRSRLFDKPYPCMRASPLPKSYGWGVHHDANGKLALFGVETDEYKQLSKKGSGLNVVVAMRTKREK